MRLRRETGDFNLVFDWTKGPMDTITYDPETGVATFRPNV